MAKAKYKVTTKFIETQNVRRVYGDDCGYDPNTKKAVAGWATVVDGIEYNENVAQPRYADETKAVVVGVAIKTFERI